MPVGTGIFLSGTLIALVVLYVATKDRWNWTKIILCPLGILLVFAAGAYVYHMILDKPRVETVFWEIPLAASESDVLFLKGKPTTKDNDRWLYMFDDDKGNWKYVYHVNFKDGKVFAVAYFSANSFDWREQIQGINIGDPENMVRDKFGVPSPSISSTDGLRRLYQYKDYI